MIVPNTFLQVIVICAVLLAAARPLKAQQGSAGPTKATSQPAARADDWPRFRGNERLTGVATSSLADKPQLLWKYTVGDVIASSAAISDGVVYFGCDNGTLFALRLDDGKEIWKSFTAASTQPSTTQPIRASIQSSPTVSGAVVYFGDNDGVFHAVNRPDGKEIWTFKTGGEIISSANCTDRLVVFGSYDGYLYCLRRADGALAWKVETEGKVHASPAIIGDKVLISGCDAKLRVIQLSDGRQAAETELGGYAGSSPAVAGQTAVIGTFANEVVGVDWANGKILWTYENPDRQFPFYSSAAVKEQYAVIGGRDKVLHCLNTATGKEIWSLRTQARVDSSAAIVGDRVAAASSDGSLLLLRIADGKETWRYELGSPTSASPAVGEGRLVVGTEDGVVFCFGDK